VKQSTRTLVCACGNRFPVEIWEGVHVSQEPELRQQVLDGTFHRFPCIVCGVTAVYDDLIGYTDFPRRHWFTIAPAVDLAYRSKWSALADQSFRATMVEFAPPLVREWSTEMTRRLIFGIQSLREKLVAFDAGLDDRVVELLKLQLIRDGALPFELGSRIELAEVTPGELRFERRSGELELTVPRAMYGALAGSPDLDAACAATFRNPTLIDHAALFVPEIEDTGDASAMG
jgi:hypothetical protein